MTAAPADWGTLRAQVLLGTERQPVHPPSPVADPLEASVLAATLVAATRRRVGAAPPVPVVDTDAAPAEELPFAPDRAGQLLDLLLTGQVGGAAARSPLVELWLRHCVDAGAVVAHASLPLLLGNAAGLDAELVRQAIGARGRWLAERNPAWRTAEDGRAARVEAGFPDDWESRPARQRADAIAALPPDPVDEAVLEAALADRAKTVRRAAAAKLARLPGSARAERMRARLAPLLSPPGRIRKLAVDLPDVPDDDDLADATDDPPAHGSVREWWLAQLIAGASLDVWPAPPAAVVKALSSEPGRVRALARAVEAARDPLWAEAVLEAGVRSVALFRLVPQAVAESLLRPAMSGPEVTHVIRSVDGPWSRETSVAAVVALARRRPEELLAFLPDVAVDLGLRLDPAVAPEVERWQSQLGEDQRHVSSALRTVRHVLSIRTEVREVFS